MKCQRGGNTGQSWKITFRISYKNYTSSKNQKIDLSTVFTCSYQTTRRRPPGNERVERVEPNLKEGGCVKHSWAENTKNDIESDEFIQNQRIKLNEKV